MNPFRDAIVPTPWETVVDVPAIHGNVLDECLHGVHHVRRSGRSAGLLIHGEAGSGKTHLLQRLRTRLAPQDPAATHRQECLYVWVRLQTSPRMIWRTLRRTLVEDWFRPVSQGRSQFDRILYHRLAEIRPAEGDLERWHEYMLDTDRPGLEAAMEEIADRLHLDRNTAVAFTHIAFGRHRRDLRAWLAGTSLPLAALERMDLAEEEGTDEAQEDEARRVVLMLCGLAGDDLPVVLSFDQVEALQMAPGDREALFVFGQLISTLHDGTSNLLLVSSVQSAFRTELRDHARSADYDRMTSLGSLSLAPLSRTEARQLIAVRREAVEIETPDSLSRSDTWPLEAREFEDLFAATDGVSPRKLLTVCAEKFEIRNRAGAADTAAAGPEPAATVAAPAQQPSPRESVPDALDRQWELLVEERRAANAPELTEEIVRHGLPLLVQLVAPDAKLVRDDRRQFPDVSLVFERAGRRSGLSLCMQSNMNSLAARLNRLKSQFDPERLQRLVIVRDGRAPLSPGARVSRQRLSELERQGAVVVHPPPEVLAAIDALRALLSDAKSGDLECGGEAIGPQTVEQWLRRHLPGALRDFVDEVLGRESDDSGPPASDVERFEALCTLLAERPVLPLDEAAQALQRPIEELTAAVHRYPAHFGLLGRSPGKLLFRVQEAAAP